MAYSIPQKNREAAFLLECNDLCDVSQIDFLDIFEDEELRNFFIMHLQKGRPGDMRSIVVKRQSGVTVTPSLETTTTIDDSTTSKEASVDASVQSVTSSLSSIFVQEKSDKNDRDFFDKRIAP